MFEEALGAARANPEGDPWAEARALGMLATIVDEVGDEEESLALAAEALAIGEGTGDRFSIAAAREGVGNALRRMWRLEEALVHLDGAVAHFRELTARWELASALTSRGILHRLAGRPAEAVSDLREAYRLCRELKERSIVTWTAGSLAKALVDAGDLGGARQVLVETGSAAGLDAPGAGDLLIEAEVSILLAEGDRESALERALGVLAAARERGAAKEVATRVWWIGRLFGPEAAGGGEEMDRARKLLEENHFEQGLREPDLLRR